MQKKNFLKPSNMKNLPINQRDSWSLLPNGKPPVVKAPAMASQEDYEEPSQERLKSMHKELQGVSKHNLTHEPTPNAFSKATFEEVEEIILPEDPKAILDGYYTLIIFVTSGIIIGAILATITMFAIYATAIERGNLMYETDDLIKLAKYNTDVIRVKVEHNEQIANKINENIDKLGSGIVTELKPKEAKIVNN